MARFALNAVGTDRPGIVAAIAEVLASLGCNLEDSRMALLHGQFAVMLILEASDSRTGEEIEQSLAEVARNFDLLVAVRPLAEELRSAEFAELVAVAVHGADHPGIVARIAREIASLDGDVIDLATHDLDIFRYVTGSEAVRLYAEAKREVHTSNEDLLTGLVRFDNGVVGVLEINWLTPTKIRELTVTGERGMFRVDYLTQDLYFYENADAGGTSWDALSVLRGVSEGAMTRYQVARVEPLLAELTAFLKAAAGEPAAFVGGEDGIAALRLAHALIESSLKAKPVELVKA